MTTENFVPPRVPVEYDAEGYLASFSPTEIDGILAFYKQYGFVVVRDVLDATECAESIADIWDYLGASGIKPEDVSTWQTWPRSSEGVITHGEYGMITPALLERRQNPTVHKIFAALHGTPELLVNHDRYIVFRPTRDVSHGDAGVKDHPEWRTMQNLHLDMNPIHYVKGQANDPDYLYVTNGLTYENMGCWIRENNAVGTAADNTPHIFGLLNFADCKANNGGFQIVPGFVNTFEKWVIMNEPYLSRVWGSPLTDWGMLPRSSQLYENAAKVTMRAGSMVIWDQRTAHGSFPNDSANFRYVQPLKLFPASLVQGPRAQRRANAIKKRIEELHWTGLTAIGQKLFGLDNLN
eukprot:TRINITY_DN69800_c0_g1_i1.p1 TRINITY_DN69800_c0_g1~~TRINITY_DN69800_c0_g1_i1.p1  ORF type:complete len:360 (-),score=46.40 TRINITY_DN69800_c0_g1_i1:3-1055(-)